MSTELFNEEPEFKQLYDLQNSLSEKVIKEDQLTEPIKYIAGVDVAYHDASDKMIGAIVILDSITFKVAEEVSHEMEITFPYVPGLFSFREIPPLIEAFKKLTIKPDLIVCDAQGIAHPKGMGMATHLGIELNIPTIGCAKKRLVGDYDKNLLGLKRGDSQELIYNNLLVGKALRTQDNTNPMFVSIGHKISLETAIHWVLKLTPDYRLPETTRQADHLVNFLLKKK
jgi:deoxyribonuclease V